MKLTIIAAAAMALLPITALQAAPILFGYDGNTGRIVTFDAATPGTIISNVALTGLPSEFLVGLDTRPANGLLYSVAVSGTASRVVTVNPITGAVTTVGAGFTPTLPVAPFYGLDFNPVPDRIRVINDAGLSVRLNPNNGAFAATDTSLSWAAGDPNAAATPAVTHVAYSNSFAGTALTTLFGINLQNNVLTRVGGVDGTPSPNGGVLTTVGPLGVVASAAIGGFEIDPASGTAFAALRVAGVSNLYRINLATGAATLVGPIGTGLAIDGLTTAPALVITSNALNLGSQVVNTTSASGTATISNATPAAITISGVTPAVAPFAQTGGTCAAAPFTLAVGASCTLSYAFTPTAVTASTQNITVSVGGVGAGTIALSGSGAALIIPVPATNLYGQLLMALMLIGAAGFAVRQRA